MTHLPEFDPLSPEAPTPPSGSTSSEGGDAGPLRSKA